MEYQFLAVIALVIIACIIGYRIFKSSKKNKFEAYVPVGKSLLDSSLLKKGKEKEGLLRLCIKNCEKEIELYPKNTSTYFYFDIALQYLAKLSEGKEKEDLLQQSEEIRNKVDILSCADALNYSYFLLRVEEGNNLRKLAGSQEGKEKEDLLHQSIKKYNEALETTKEYINLSGYLFSNIFFGLYTLNRAIYETSLDLNPENPKIHFDYGLALFNLTGLLETEDLKEDLLQACTKYLEKALELDDKYAIAYDGLGRVLLELSLFKNEHEQELLLCSCIEKYEKALKFNSSNSNIYAYMGLALSILATLKNGEEKEGLLRSCVEKYLKLLEINPTDIIYERLGLVLQDLSTLKYGKEKEDLLSKSEEMIKKASELKSKSSKLGNPLQVAPA